MMSTGGFPSIASSVTGVLRDAGHAVESKTAAVTKQIQGAGQAAKESASTFVQQRQEDVKSAIAAVKSVESRIAAPFRSSIGGSAIVGVPLVTMTSSLDLEYAGSSFAVGDFNGDGTSDVSLGAWGHTHVGAAAAAGPSRRVVQSGAVYTRVCYAVHIIVFM